MWNAPTMSVEIHYEFLPTKNKMYTSKILTFIDLDGLNVLTLTYLYLTKLVLRHQIKVKTLVTSLTQYLSRLFLSTKVGFEMRDNLHRPLFF